MGNHVNSCPGGTVPYLCSVAGSYLHRINSSIPYGSHVWTSWSWSWRRLAAPGESLLGCGICLFLLQPPHHPLPSPVLRGLPRALPQLSHPVSNGDLSISVAFLLFYQERSCSNCNVRGVCGQAGSCPARSWDSQRNGRWGAPRRLLPQYLWALNQHMVDPFVMSFSSLCPLHF